MKNRLFITRIFTLILLVGILLELSLLAGLAQDTNAVPASGNANVDVAAGVVASLVGALSAKYGWLTTVIVWIGVLRLAFKPVMLLVETVVKATPGTEDDAKLAAFEGGPVYKWLVWGLDWLASVKPPGANTNPLSK